MNNVLPGNFHHQIFLNLVIFTTPKVSHFYTLQLRRRFISVFSTKDMRMPFPHFMTTLFSILKDATVVWHTLNTLLPSRNCVREHHMVLKQMGLVWPTLKLSVFTPSLLLLDHTLLSFTPSCRVLKGSEKRIPYECV